MSFIPKIAVCISGHLKQKPSRVDIAEATVSIRNAFGRSRFVEYFIYVTAPPEATEVARFYKDVLDPRKVVVNEDDSHLQAIAERYNNKSAETNVLNTLKMTHKLQRCNELKKEFEQKSRGKFDLVFRLRPDMFFEKKFRVWNLLGYGKDKIYVPYYPWDKNSNAIADFFAVGDTDMMDYYCSLQSKMDEYYAAGCKFHPETLVGFHLQQGNININKIQSPCVFNKHYNDNGYNLIDL